MWLLDVVALKEYKRVFENILAVEKKLDIARKHLVSHTFYCGRDSPDIRAMFNRQLAKTRRRNCRRSW